LTRNNNNNNTVTGVQGKPNTKIIIVSCDQARTPSLPRAATAAPGILTSRAVHVVPRWLGVLFVLKRSPSTSTMRDYTPDVRLQPIIILSLFWWILCSHIVVKSRVSCRRLVEDWDEIITVVCGASCCNPTDYAISRRPSLYNCCLISII
jgi:hypothetical protein